MYPKDVPCRRSVDGWHTGIITPAAAIHPHTSLYARIAAQTKRGWTTGTARHDRLSSVQRRRFSGRGANTSTITSIQRAVRPWRQMRFRFLSKYQTNPCSSLPNPRSLAVALSTSAPAPIGVGTITILVGPLVTLSKFATQQRRTRNLNSLCNKTTGATPMQRAFGGRYMPAHAEGSGQAYCPIIGTKGCHW